MLVVLSVKVFAYLIGEVLLAGVPSHVEKPRFTWSEIQKLKTSIARELFYGAINNTNDC